MFIETAFHSALAIFSMSQHCTSWTRRSNALHGWMPLPPPLRTETPKTRGSLSRYGRRCLSCWHIILFSTSSLGTMPATHICLKGRQKHPLNLTMFETSDNDLPVLVCTCSSSCKPFAVTVPRLSQTTFAGSGVEEMGVETWIPMDSLDVLKHVQFEPYLNHLSRWALGKLAEVVVSRRRTAATLFRDSKRKYVQQPRPL